MIASSLLRGSVGRSAPIAHGTSTTAWGSAHRALSLLVAFGLVAVTLVSTGAAPASALPSFDGAAISAAAKSAIGQFPYVSPGATSDKLSDLAGGTDCSGLAYFAYRQSGITLGTNSSHSSTDVMIKSFDKLSGESSAVPGDLVFYGYQTSASDYTDPSGTTWNVTHVGVYIGDGNRVDSISGDATNNVKVRAAATGFNYNGNYNSLIGYFHIKPTYATGGGGGTNTGFHTDGPIDFNGDNKTDVFTVSSDGQWWYSSGGVASFQKLAMGGASTQLSQLAFGNFNGDYKTDVFTVSSDGQWWYSNGGVASFQKLAMGSASVTIGGLRVG